MQDRIGIKIKNSAVTQTVTFSVIKKMKTNCFLNVNQVN